MSSRRKWWTGGAAKSRRPKQPGRKLRLERWGGATRSLSLEALEIRAMLTGHPLIIPTTTTSSFVQAETATVAVAPAQPIGWTPTSTNLADPVNGPLAKGGPGLVELYQNYLDTQQAGATTSLATVLNSYPSYQFSGDSVSLEFVSSGTVSFSTFVSDLEAEGAQPTTISEAYNAVDAYVPVANLGAIAEMTEVRAMNPLIRPTAHIAYDPGAGGPPMNVGAVTSQGDTGTGVKVGVISDSVNNAGGLTTGQADGYLPGVQVLGDEADGQGTDEGAAMLEEIHAIAPGATLAFDTGGDSQLSMSQAVSALANVGSKVIVDDLGYDNEPFFEPGIIDDAIGTAVSNGAIYFGAAGNAGNDGFYEASNWTLENGTYVFNWNGGSTTNPADEMAFTAAVNGGTELDLEWDNSFNGLAFNGNPGSNNVVDNVQVQIDYVDPVNGLEPIAPLSIAEGFTGGEANAFATGMPFQSFFLPLDGEYVISATIQNSAGGLLTPTSALPDALEFVTQDIGNTLSSFSIGATAPPGDAITTYGHSAGPNTIGVGAVDSAAPTVSELYSAYGPAFYYFDSNGVRIAGGPTTELNPFISAPDDINEDINYPMFYPFDGTSAAAANAAGAAALLVSADPTMNQALMEKVLAETATPIDGQAQSTWEDQAGYGLINVDAAFNALAVVNDNPQMDVSGGGQGIAYGEISPSALNDTDFGSTSDAGGTITETYTITNVGKSDPLDLTTLTVTPTSTITGFSVVAPGFSGTTLDPGQTATFQIEFTPTTAGTATATVSIGSNDTLNPTPFVFEITATGTAPETTMELTGNGHDIAYNSSNPSTLNDTYFGSTFDNGAALSETFTIVNASATLPLAVTSVSVTPTASSAITGFSVSSGSGAAAIAPGMSATFTILFTPNGTAGVATATVSIVSDDETNPIPFVFEVSATSLMPVSSMEVEGENNQVIVDGAPPAASNGTLFAATLDNGASTTQTFTIVSNGENLPLNISKVSLVPTIGSGFAITAPLLTSVPAGSSTTFTATFTPTAPGTDSAEIEIFSSDSSHPSPFIIDITGTAVNPPPTIVSQIDDSNTTGFSLAGTWSTYSAGVNGSEHYAAAGTGNATATYTFTGLTPGQYEVLGTWAPMPNAASNAPYAFYDGGTPIGSAVVNQSVAPNGAVVSGYQVLGLVNITSNTLRVTLSNDANGAVIADSIEIGVLPHLVLKNPQLVVSDDLMAIATNATPEVGNGTDFGLTTIKTGSTIHTFTLTNDGLATLTFGSTPVRALGAAFSIVSQPPVTSLAPGASTTFQVEFAPTATGLQTGSVAISTNDPNYPSAFELFLQGTGTTAAETAAKAQIAILGDGVSIAKNVAPLTTNGTSFGDAVVTTGSVIETYTIENAGGTTLTLTGASPITVTGTGFSLVGGQPAVKTLPPGTSETFQVKFVPASTGLKTGTISIASSDPVNPAYLIQISGTGIAAATSKIAVSDNSAAIVPGGTPELANGTNFGSATEITGTVKNTYTITNNGSTTLTLTGVSPVSATGAFTVSTQPASDALAPGSSTTFSVTFVPTSVGLQTGTVTITSNDPQFGTFTFNVQGTGIASANLPTIIDDSQTGFSLVGAWSTTKFGFDGGEHYAAAGTGSLQALYSFTGLTPGIYQIYATWSDVGTPSKPASNTPYTFSNGVTTLGSASVNQQVAPTGTSFDNTPFQLIGTVDVTSSLLRVTLNNKANGIVLADAIGIVKLPATTAVGPQISLFGDGMAITTTGTPESANGTNFGNVIANVGSVTQSYTITNTGSTTLSLIGSFPVTVTGAGFTLLGEPTIDSLAPGAATSFQVEFAPTAIATDNGTITIASNDPATPSFSFAIQGAGVGPFNDLSITKTDNDGGSSISGTTGSATANGSIVYTITVANPGPSPAMGAKITDTFPSVITGDTFTVATTGGASDVTNATGGSGNIADTVDLPVGGTITYTVTANIGANTASSMTNTATVTDPAGTTDDSPSNTASDTDNFNAGLAITKTDNDGGSSVTATEGVAPSGGSIIYTITVTNSGPNAAVGAKVADTLPTDVTSDTFTVATTDGAVDVTNATSGSGNIADTVNLPSGSSIVYTVTAAVSSSATGTLSNTATITPPTNVVDPTPADLTATDTDTIAPAVDLVVDKVDNAGGSSNGVGLASQISLLQSFDGVQGAAGLLGLPGETQSSLAAFGSTLYGVTEFGGQNGDGEVYSINTNGTGFTVLASFDGTDGENPLGQLVISADGSTLYGTTDEGGANGEGEVFSLSTGGGAINVLHSFDTTDGAEPVGGLTLSGSTLYGTTTAAGEGLFGPNLGGEVFSISTSGAAFSVLHAFDGTDGSEPVASLTVSGSTIYGTTEQGGANGDGEVFSLGTSGGTLSVLHAFNGADGADPESNLVLSGSTLYGTAAGGTGTYAQGGDVFSVSTAGAAFTVMFSFGSSSDGESPVGNLVLSGGWLYGTALLGTGLAAGGGSGTVFGVSIFDTVSGGVSLSDDLTSATSGYNTALGAGGGLALVGSTLYGATNGGGAFGEGGVFAITPTGIAQSSTITYELSVSNTGPNNAVGVAVSDPLSTNTGLSGVTYTAVANGGATGFTASGSGSIADTVDLPAGSTIFYTITATVAAGPTGTLTNTATATVGPGEANTNPSSVAGVTTATDSDPIVPHVDLTVTNSDNVGGSSTNGTAGSLVPGATVKFTVVVTNSGPSNGVGIQIADPVGASADLSNITYTAVGTAGATGFTASGTGSILNTVNLAVGASITYTITAEVVPGASGTLITTATAMAGPGEVDSAPGAFGNIASATDSDTL